MTKTKSPTPPVALNAPMADPKERPRALKATRRADNDRFVDEQRAAATGGKVYREKIDRPVTEPPRPVKPGHVHLENLDEIDRVVFHDRRPVGAGNGGGSRGGTRTPPKRRTSSAAIAEHETVKTVPVELTLRRQFVDALDRAGKTTPARERVNLGKILQLVHEHFEFALRTRPDHVRFGRVGAEDSRGTKTVFMSIPGESQPPGKPFSMRMPVTIYEELHDASRSVLAGATPTSKAGKREFDAGRIDVALRIFAAEVRLHRARAHDAGARPDHNSPPDVDGDAAAIAGVTPAEFARIAVELPVELATIREQARKLHDEGVLLYRIGAELHDTDGRRLWSSSDVIASFVGAGLWSKPRRRATPEEERVALNGAPRRRKTRKVKPVASAE